MSKGDNSPGISKLAGVFKDMVAQGVDSGVSIDFGEIQKDKSLLLNSYPIPIPKADFLACHRLKDSLKAGNRVLVVWVDDDPVIVDTIIDGSEAF